MSLYRRMWQPVWGQRSQGVRLLCTASLGPSPTRPEMDFIGCMSIVGRSVTPTDSAPAEFVASEPTGPALNGGDPTGAPPSVPPRVSAPAGESEVAAAEGQDASSSTPTLTEEPALAGPTPNPVAAAIPAARAPRTFQATPEPEALDLLELAGGAAMKRLLPVALAGAAAVAVVIYVLARR